MNTTMAKDAPEASLAEVRVGVISIPEAGRGASGCPGVVPV